MSSIKNIYLLVAIFIINTTALLPEAEVHHSVADSDLAAQHDQDFRDLISKQNEERNALEDAIDKRARTDGGTKNRALANKKIRTIVDGDPNNQSYSIHLDSQDYEASARKALDQRHADEIKKLSEQHEAESKAADESSLGLSSLLTSHTEKSTPSDHTTTSTNTTSSEPEDMLARYKREDEELKKVREQEDTIREELWKEQDDAAISERNKQGFAERMLKAFASDHATDEEIAKKRNETILEINKERLTQDFAIKAKRFDDFKTKHAEFAKQGPWDKLLNLGDMNKFTNMSHEERTAMLQDIRKAIAAPDAFEKDFDINALNDLLGIVKLHDPNGTEPLSHHHLAELHNMPEEEQQRVKKALIEGLKDSLGDSLDKLERFNDVMENMESIKKLQDLRAIKDISVAASVVLGTAGCVAIVAQPHIALAGFALSAEKLFIGAKINLVISHISGAAEAKASAEVQNQIKDLFGSLTTGTTLVDAREYHNHAKTLGTRIKEYWQDKLPGKFFKGLGKIWDATAGKVVAAIGKGIRHAHGKAQESWKGSAAQKHLNAIGDRINAAGRAISDGAKAVKHATWDKTAMKKHFDKKAKEKYESTRSEFDLKGTPSSESTVIPKHIPKPELPTASGKSFKEYTDQMDDYNKKLKEFRKQENIIREKLEKIEHDKAVSSRDKQSLAERFVKKLTADAASDEEIEKARNESILKINRERLTEDFAAKAKTFDTFKEQHAEFAKSEPWSKLLDLGDMNKFTSMTHEERTDMINGIKTALADPDALSKTSDVEALQDLLRAVKLHDSEGTPIDENLFQSMEGKSAAEQEKAKEMILKGLHESLNASVQKLEVFNEAMEHIEGINDLNDLRKVRDVSIAASAVLGVAGLVAMTAQPHIAFAMHAEEQFIGAKLSLLTGHLSAAREAKLSIEVQNRIKDLFKSLTPSDATEFIDAQEYKVQAKTIGQRLADTALGKGLGKLWDATGGKVTRAVHDRWQGSAAQKHLHEARDSVTRKLNTAQKSAKEKYEKTKGAAQKHLDQAGTSLRSAAEKTTLGKKATTRIDQKASERAQKTKEKHDETRSEYALAGQR